MTQEIKRKIADAVKQYAENNSPKQLVIPAYHDAAHFGYSLASAELAAANQRIKELEGQLSQSINLYNCQNSAIIKRDERIKELEAILERASWLVGNPGTNISSSTDLACESWQEDYKKLLTK